MDTTITCSSVPTKDHLRRGENAVPPRKAALMKALKFAAKQQDSQYPSTKSGCLGQCERGISCVVYPEGVWYTLTGEETFRFARTPSFWNGCRTPANGGMS